MVCHPPPPPPRRAIFFPPRAVGFTAWSHGALETGSGSWRIFCGPCLGSPVLWGVLACTGLSWPHSRRSEGHQAHGGLAVREVKG